MDNGSIGGAKRHVETSGTVPLNSRHHADEIDREKRISSGHIAGNNLIIEDYNGDGIADGDSTGARPTLSPPLMEPTLSGYQTVADQLKGAGDVKNQNAMIKMMENRSGGDVARQLAKQGSSPIIKTDSTDTTMTATLQSGEKFHADFTTKNLMINKDGHDIKFSLNSDNPSATIDGKSVSFDQGEMKVLSDFFVLMELFHEMGVLQRKSSREARNATNAGVVKNIKNQAEEQKKAAVNTLVAGVVSGTVKMAAAGMSMVGAVKGMQADAAAAKAGQAPNTFQGSMISQKYSAFGSAFEGAGEMGASGAKYQAAQHEAEQTTLRAGEEQLKHVKQTEQDQMQAAQELLNKARETFAQVWAQMIQTLQNQARNI